MQERPHQLYGRPRAHSARRSGVPAAPPAVTGLLATGSWGGGQPCSGHPQVDVRFVWGLWTEGVGLLGGLGAERGRQGGHGAAWAWRA